MLVLRDRLLHTPLLSLQTGAAVGSTASAIIDPKNLQIVAFYCEGETIDFSPAVIHTVDIREFSDIGMIINSASDIMPPDDLVRLQEIIDRNFTLEGTPVIDEHQHKMGKVIGYTVDLDNYYIAKLHVRPPFLQSLSVSEFLIDRGQVVDVTAKAIIVRATTKKVTNDVSARLQNPFQQPQPGTAKAQQSQVDQGS